jgi:hypothetical protein
MLVTAAGADAQVGKIAGMPAMTAKQQTPLTRQLIILTLWIGAAATIVGKRLPGGLHPTAGLRHDVPAGQGARNSRGSWRFVP